MTESLVRHAEANDADAVFRLAARFATSFAVEEAAFRASFVALLENPDAYLAVAESTGDEVIGYILAFRHRTFFANGYVAWIEELMVDESHRKQGVGRALTASAEGWAVAAECRMIALATRRASEFYQSVGYEESAAYFRKSL